MGEIKELNKQLFAEQEINSALLKRLEDAEQKLAKAERDKTGLFDIGYGAEQKLKDIHQALSSRPYPDEILEIIESIIWSKR